MEVGAAAPDGGASFDLFVHLDTVATDGKVEWRPQAKGVVPQLFVHRLRDRRSGPREAGAQPTLRDRVSEKDQASLWCRRRRRRRLLPVQAPPPHLSRPAGKVVARDTIARDWRPRRPLVLKLSGERLAARPDAAHGRWVAAARSPPQLVEEGAEDRGRCDDRDRAARACHCCKRRLGRSERVVARSTHARH